MSEQIEHDEYCYQCGDELIAMENWDINDVRSNLLFCTKEECQEAKPVTITSKATVPKEKKKQPQDKGLSRTLKQKRTHIKFAPDPVRVATFAEYLKNPDMWNEEGFPIYSMIFKHYQIFDPERGFEVAEMAAAQFPEEVDDNGCPSIQACNSVRGYLKRITKRYNGNLEIFSTRVVKQEDPYKGRRVWRWHTLKNKSDLDKQVNDMLAISKNIELSAKKRENNFNSTTFEQRMEKVGILDQFFA